MHSAIIKIFLSINNLDLRLNLDPFKYVKTITRLGIKFRPFEHAETINE